MLRGKYRIPFYMSTDCENLLKKFLVAMYARVNERLRDRASIIRMIVKFNVFAWRTLHSHLAMGTAVYRQDQGGNERSELTPKLLLLK